MASIIASVFKATIGLLVNKGRDMTADKLKEGDVTDEKFRSLIVREIDDIKSKLDGLARKDLLTSISFFKEGLVYLYKVLDLVKTSDKGGKLTAQGTMRIQENSLSSAAASVKTVSLAGEMKSLQLTGQDDSRTRALSDAKDRFKQAREKATEAFCNEALSTPDRILAMQYRVMATLLEKVDNPADALAACRLCLEELHAMPAVQKSFNVHFKRGFKSRFNKAEREETIHSVYRVNRVIFSVTIMIGGGMNLSLWPCVDHAEEKVDPLRDTRVTESLQEHYTEPLLLKQWSLVQEGEEETTNMTNCCITTNTLGQFIIVDSAYLRFFDSSGKYLYSNRLPLVEREMRVMDWHIQGIAFDRNNNVFLLVSCSRLQKDWSIRYWSTVYLCDEHGNLQHKFELKEGSRGSFITVSDNNNVFVAVGKSNAQEVQVYDTKGLFINSFGKAKLNNILAITATNSADCKIILMDCDSYGVIVYMFTEQGDYLSQLNWRSHHWYCALNSIAYHRVTDHVFVLHKDVLDFERKINSSRSYPQQLRMLTKDGMLIRKIHLPLAFLRYRYEQPLKTTVTNEGLVVMCAVDKRTHKRMIITL